MRIAFVSSPSGPSSRRFLGILIAAIVLLAAALSIYASSSENDASPPPESTTPFAELVLRSAGLDQTISITLSDDTYVSEAQPNKSFGTSPTFYIYGYPGHRSHALLRFRIDGWPPDRQVDVALLRLRILENSGAGGQNARVELLAADAAWDEMTVTWNNQPDADPDVDPVVTALQSYSSGAMDGLDITSLINHALESQAVLLAGAQPKSSSVVIPLRVMLDAVSQMYSQEWYTKEGMPSGAPRIMISYPVYTCTPTLSPTLTQTPTQTPTPTATPVAVAIKRMRPQQVIPGYQPNEVIPGEVVSSTILLTWDSPDGEPAPSTMVDNIPEHLEYIAGSASATLGVVNDADPRRLVWNGVIPDGGSASISFLARVRCNTLMRLLDADYPERIENRATGMIGPIPYAAVDHIKPIKPDLQVTAIEATQVIQNLANDMRLIADKETYARVYVAAVYPDGRVGCDVPMVTARLRGPGGAEIAPINGFITLLSTPGDRPTEAERRDLNRSLNFRLPASWRQGAYTLVAEVNPFVLRPDANRNNNIREQPVRFVATKPIHLVFHQTRQKYAGRDITAVKHMAELFIPYTRMFPLAEGNIRIYWDSILNVTWSMILNEDLVRTLELVKNQASWWWDDAETFRIGLVHNDVPTADTVGLAYQPGNATWVKMSGSIEYQGMTLVHELGHNLGCGHVPCDVADGTGGAWAATGYPNCQLSTGSRTDYYGFDPGGRTIMVRDPRTHSDVMSYRDPQWISDFSYNCMYNRVSTTAAGPATSSVELGDGGQRFFVSGWITTTANSPSIGSLSTVYVQDNPTYRNDSDTGRYSIEARDSQGNVLASQSWETLVVPSGSDLASNEPLDVIPFLVALPYHVDARELVLKDGDRMLASRKASANPPDVALLSPNGGETIGDELHAEWTATDADGDELVYTVLWSHDNGATWRPVAINITETTLTADASELAGSDACLLRVVASDGFFSVEDRSDAPFTAPRRPPTAMILQPSDGTHYREGEAVLLYGQAYDQERQPIPEGSLVWTSDRDGLLGNGEELMVMLSPGDHLVTLTATDGHGLGATRTITVRVRSYPAWLPMTIK